MVRRSVKTCTCAGLTPSVRSFMNRCVVFIIITSDIFFSLYMYHFDNFDLTGL